MTDRLEGYIGDTASILLTMFGPQQHDSHVRRYRIHRADRKLTTAMVKITHNIRNGRPPYEGVN